MRTSFCSDHRVDADGHLSVLRRMQGARRTPVAFTDDLDEAVKAYRNTQCYTDEYKHFVVHYHDYVKETNL